MGQGENEAIVEYLATHARTRVGGGVRTVEKAKRLLALGAERVVVGTAAFTSTGPDEAFLRQLVSEVAKEHVLLALDSKNGNIVVKGWQESIVLTAESVATARAFLRRLPLHLR
ncbi:MAG: HisA/HisF-related TIM barrel protein [Bryobacteraceae bacterium]